MKEVQYLEWLAIVVMVKKPNEKWWMCVDFTNLKKECLNDNFPLLRIHLLVDSTTGHKLLSFMGAFFGYNQIQMRESDQENTSFITNRGLYYYQVMPLWIEECRSHLSKACECHVQDADLQKYGSLG